MSVITIASAQDIIHARSEGPVIYQIEKGVHVRIVQHIQGTDNYSTAITCILEQESFLEYCLIITGAPVVNITLEILLQGEYAHARVLGAYSLTMASSVTIQTKQLHQARATTSELRINGLLFDTARLSYNGLIYKAPAAWQSSALQENKTILFSPHAKVHSVPGLEVLTDQVRCTHGSAMGKLDTEMMQYAQGRGLSYQQAQELLAEAFFENYLSEYTQKDSHIMQALMSPLK